MNRQRFAGVGLLIPLGFLGPLALVALVFAVTHWIQIFLLGIVVIVGGLLLFVAQERARVLAERREFEERKRSAAEANGTAEERRKLAAYVRGDKIKVKP